MNRFILYILFISVLFSACEDVYIPDIDEVENVIVADARIEVGSNNNMVVLTETMSFNSSFYNYPEVSGGKVTLIDDTGSGFELPQVETGKFHVNVDIEGDRQYKIQVEYNGDIFESEYEKVPGVPSLDTVYGISTTKIVAPGGSASSADFRTVQGVQLYADMVATEETPNYRFTADKVAEYIWEEESEGGLAAPIIHFYWEKSVVSENFNIAAPPQYSTTNSIKKHPLFFVGRSITLEPDSAFTGWILVLYQHGISNSVYNFYNDLNAQLNADGRIFDPVYVQARNNFKCVNNDTKAILGNFEISRKTETRYFIRFISDKSGYRVQKLSDRSPISWQGETIDTPPDFWAF